MPSPSPSPTPTSTQAKPQNRRRAIRTYGKKRAFSDGPAEDATQIKRQKTEDAPLRRELSREPAVEANDDATQPVQRSSPQNPNRAGILRYFQPMPLQRSSSSSSSCSAKSLSGSSEAAPNTPPLSPPLTARPRQKRRLTIRPDQIQPAQKEEPRRETGEETDKQRTEHNGGMAASSIRMRARLRREAEENENDSKDECQDQGPTRARRKPSTPAVQTTLSLAVGGDGFKECKECNILYNPLHEKDAKFHARYHASMARKKGV